MPLNVAACLDKAWVTEPYSLQVPENCRAILRDYMKNHWHEIVAHWDTIATTDKRKWVLLSLGETLDSTNYMGFLETLRALKEKGKISSEMFETAAIMPGQQKEAFLALNYQNSRVRDYINSIRDLLPTNQGKYLSELLSGFRKRYWEEQYRRSGIVLNSDLLLPASHAAASTNATASQQLSMTGTPTAAAERRPRKTDFPITPAVILVAAIAGAAIFLLRHRKP
jgi:hypothetical protein